MTYLEGETQRVDKRSAEPNSFSWVNAIVLCTKLNSVKYWGVADHLAKSMFRMAPIIPMTPHQVPEVDFNHITTRADIVAAMKTLQTPINPLPMVHHVLGKTHEHPSQGGEPVAVATDVMLDIKQNGIWVAHNKPDPASSRSELFDSFMSMLSPGNARLFGGIEARLRVGAATYCMKTKRGIAGTTETFFTLKPLEEEEIRRYMSPYSLDDLLKTNAALRWEDDTLRKQIQSVNGVPVEDSEFTIELNTLLKQAQGALPEIGNLLGQTNRFRLSGAAGHLNDVAAFARDVLPRQKVGSWGLWHT